MGEEGGGKRYLDLEEILRRPVDLLEALLSRIRHRLHRVSSFEPRSSSSATLVVSRTTQQLR